MVPGINSRGVVFSVVAYQTLKPSRNSDCFKAYELPISVFVRSEGSSIFLLMVLLFGQPLNILSHFSLFLSVPLIAPVQCLFYFIL